MKSLSTQNKYPQGQKSSLKGKWASRLEFQLDWRGTSLNSILPEANGLCLDLGCGNGRNRPQIEKCGYTWIGADIEYRDGNLSCFVDAMSLPFRNGVFDAVVLWQVLEHIPNPWQVVREIKRVLKPRGYIVGSVSYLEPFHDTIFYFGFGHLGIQQILKDSSFTKIKVEPGITCFSLILRGWFIKLIGDRYGEKIAFVLTKIWFLPLLWIYSAAAYLGTLLHLEVVSGRRIWLRERAAFEFAGHIRFLAQK